MKRKLHFAAERQRARRAHRKLRRHMQRYYVMTMVHRELQHRRRMWANVVIELPADN